MDFKEFENEIRKNVVFDDESDIENHINDMYISYKLNPYVETMNEFYDWWFTGISYDTHDFYLKPKP